MAIATSSLNATLMTSSREGSSKVAPSVERRVRLDPWATRYTSLSGEKEKDTAVSESGGDLQW